MSGDCNVVNEHNIVDENLVKSGTCLGYLVVMSSHIYGTSKNNLKIMWLSIIDMIMFCIV